MKINWDRAPPDAKELQHFFTEESFKEWSAPCDLTDKIVTKFKELGSFHEFYWQKANAVDSSKLVNADVYCEQSQKPSGAVQLACNTNQMTKVQSAADALQSTCQKTDISPVKSQNVELLHHKDWHVPYPRISWFTKSEQAFYVQHFLYFKNHKKLDDKALSKYTELAKMHQRVHLEQEEFMDYLKLVSLKFKEHYAFLPPVAQRYMQEKYEVDLARLHSCDQFYITFDKVPIFSNKVTSHKFCDSKTVLEMGNVPACLLTNKKNKPKTVLDYKHLTSRYPIHQKTPGKHDSSWCHQVCSEDQNAEELAKKYQCDIVVSSSVLNCLVRNHSPGFKNNWDISVIIKNYNLPGPEGEFQHKVVYLNKPFYHSLNTREINSRFHKISLASKILYPHHMTCFSFNSCNGDNSDVDVDVTELETFGIGQSVKKTYEKDKRKEPQTQSTLAQSSNDKTTETAQNLSPTKTLPLNKDLKTTNEISGSSSAISSEKAVHLEISEPLTDHLVSPSKDCCSFTSTSTDRRHPLVPACHYFPEESTSASEDSDHSSHLIIITDDNTDLDKSIDKTKCGEMADAVSKIISDSCISVRKTVSATQTSAVTVIPPPPSLSTLPVQEDIAEIPLQDALDTPLQDSVETSLQNIVETSLQDSVGAAQKDTVEIVLQESVEVPLQDSVETLQDTNEAPLQDSVETLLEDTGKISLQDSVAIPLQDMTKALLQDSEEASLQDSMETPFQDTAETLLQDAAETPLQDSVDAPPHDLVQTSLQDSMETPLQDISETPFQDLTEPPVKDTPSSPDSSERSYLHSLPFLEKEMKIIPTESDGNVFVFQDVPKQNSSPVKSMLTSVPDEPSQFSHPIRNDNISYTVWNFGELRILVRSRYHAVKSKNKQKKTFLHLLPKLEYQSKCGYEETTQDELSKMWISSLIRKEIPVLKVRIDAFTSEILMYETCNFQKILQKFNPVHCNTFLYNIFCKFHSLKSSRYLLSHCAGETSCIISEAVSNRHTILNCSDLYQKYSKNINAAHPLNVPWIPLDTQLLTPYHISNGRIPATFNPKGKRKWKKKNVATSSQKSEKKAKRS
ncbi:little elongation complex subunit 2 [Octopus bimaculoides]|uniref:Little elongation complex subunit 2 C-terminal domain-containing protein n=1 Tax=Octopus bimaculoides TaxID=37653 RepID=A0A0L8G4J9_OCTBM|nr:little elongation complex subunit 2 [Octopus bimaculoides]|eukprot:XP_014784101.1 PREDICTED: little elongation complex subunit 2-like [Octopus bimaculoides]